MIKRIAVLDRDLCQPKKCFYECIAACPVNRQGVNCIEADKEKKAQPIIHEDVCIGCALCWRKCPFEAWNIVNLLQELNESPIHRFGENGFELFRLPIPVKGVVGLLGPNGVGKTTALRILSGQIKPNLSLFDKEPDLKDLIRLSRGTELQSYLEQMDENKIKAVYKPQQINLIPENVSGNVSKFISDSNIIKKLDLQNCLEKELKDLSGGELQRVSIAKAIEKEGDIYYFDEPTSYLDVKQRINVAKVIHELSEKKYVMVVEHDLATLDFLADRIHIFYGNPGVFGIVSKPYSTKLGINIFLSGYIKEENVKIRDPIIFQEATTEKRGRKETLIQFDNIRKEYNKFSLNIEKGDIRKDEVLGVFGSNALGKTTFAKILAGEIEFEGNINKIVKISYKPQYLDIKFDGTVDQILNDSKNSPDFLVLKNHLQIDKLLLKNVSTLSGGELQRVAIMICLCKQADLYLLDEPSAYLDVDQRLAVAKAIRQKTSMVIDHDLLFLSYIADRAMLFTGIPGKEGHARILDLKDGFNTFLKDLDITFRRDPETKRPRANKFDSVKDREQKENGEYFYN